jgi:hypothetical protein
MSGLQPSGAAASININNRGFATNGQVSNQTPTATVATTPTVTYQYTNANMTPADQVVFANPTRLFGDTILNMATRYATTDIATNVNAAAGKQVITRYITNYRLRIAIKAYAARIGQTPGEVTAGLTATRVAAGIRCVDSAGTAQVEEKHTGETTEDESDSDNEASAAAPGFTVAPAAPAAPIPTNDQFLFNNHMRLMGETLLVLAERYSNKQISTNIGKKSGTDQFTLSQTAMSQRMITALTSRAKATNSTLEQVRANLHATRKSNNVDSRAPAGTRMDTSRKSTANMAKVEPAPKAVVATQAPTAAAQEGVGVEMTDNSNGQQGHTAAELDAANSLLLLCQPLSQEVIDAARILMTLHSNDGAETEDEVSDTEMDDAEKADFMADFQARWRSRT